jgi:hypothetical protein
MSDTTPATGETTDNPEGKAPEFEGEFDAEKAQRLVANLRAEVASLKERTTALTAERDDFKAAAEKTGEDRDKALKEALDRAEAAERTLAIKKHNLPDDVVEEFADYLTGSADEVDAKAAKLAARLGAPKEEQPAEQPSGEETPEEPAPVLPERPKPALTPGHGGEVTPEFDPAAIAKAARR